MASICWGQCQRRVCSFLASFLKSLVEPNSFPNGFNSCLNKGLEVSQCIFVIAHLTCRNFMLIGIGNQ